MVKVLFLEDEPVIQEVLSEYMKLQHYAVYPAADGEEAIGMLEEGSFEIAVLDIMVPKISGLEVLNYIRQKDKHMPVIMLTAIDEDHTQLQAFNLYADDYVIKPVSPLILLKRMETILRRSRYYMNSEMETSGLYIQEEAYQAFYGGEPLGLTVSEFLLLQTLYKRPDMVFTREQLILHIFNEDYIGNDRIIDAHVKNLRKKIPVNCIRTVIGVGYQYAAGCQGGVRKVEKVHFNLPDLNDR